MSQIVGKFKSTLKSTLSPAHTSVADAVMVISCIDTVTANLSVLSQPFTVCVAYTICPSARAVVESNKLPPVAASYHWMLSPVAVKSATVEEVQKVCSASPVGAEQLSLFFIKRTEQPLLAYPLFLKVPI